jgi:hypothetical protein
MHHGRSSDMSKRIEFDATTARILLDLADDHKDVKTDSQGPRLSLVVSDELWERYEKYQGLEEGD